MAFDRLSASAGVSGLNCISRVGNELFVLGNDDLYAINEAGQIRSLAGGQIRRTILDEIDGAGGPGGSFVAYNAAANEWMIFPCPASGVGIRNSYTLHVASGKWTRSRWASGAEVNTITAAAQGPAGEYVLTVPTRTPTSPGVLLGKGNVAANDHILWSVDCPQAATANYVVLDQPHLLEKKEID